jgi:hypothetical protein
MGTERMGTLGRFLALVIIGGLVGGAAADYIMGMPPGPGSSGTDGHSFLERLARFAARRAGDGPANVSERLAAYRSAAAMTDAAALERALARAAEAPRSARADLEVDALLPRLSELDPARAVTVADSLGLAEIFVVRAVQLRARTDMDAALSALGGLRDADTRRAAALGLLDAAGDGAAGLERVAAALPADERGSFTVEGIAWRARNDPPGALRDALSLGDADAREEAVLRVAGVWAKRDPVGALSRTSSLAQTLQSEYRRVVGEQWAHVDLAGCLAYIEASANPEAWAGVMPLWSAAADPERILELAARRPGAVDHELSMLAMMVSTERDPEAALTRVDALPAGQDREQLLAHLAVVYARKDPDAALAWLDSMSPAPAQLQLGVFATIVGDDPERALALLDRLPPSVDVANVIMLAAGSAASEDPGLAVRLAEGFLARADRKGTTALTVLLSNWMQREPDEALDWIVASSGRFDISVLGNVLQRLASVNPKALATSVNRVPPGVRDEWIRRVAGPYSREDPSAALSWIAQYRGQEAYEPVLRQVITQSAKSEPEAAAQLLTQSTRSVQMGAARSVATNWSRQNPRAAAQWVMGLSDARVRALALEPVVASWAVRDLASAERWTMGLPGGEARDQALGALLARQAVSGSVDRKLLDSFDSDTARQRALASQMRAIARRDPDAAQDLADEYLTNPGSREEARAMIEALASP